MFFHIHIRIPSSNNINKERKPNSYRDGDGDLYQSTRVHDDKKSKIK